jgi:hypothetical protein
VAKETCGPCTGGAGSCGAALRASLPVATLEDTLHLAKGLQRRVQERLPQAMQE